MMEEAAFYLYGVTQAGATEAGLPQGVFTIRVGKVEALVKEVSLEEFGEEALKRNLKDPKWLQAQIWEHEGVLEAVMRKAAVLPMKFGTIFITQERLFERLQAHETQLLQLLEQLAGHEEWGVKGFCDRSFVESRIKQESDKLKALEARQVGQPAGTAFLLKKKEESLLKEEVEMWLTKEIQAIYEGLLPYSSQAKLNPPLGQGLTELTGKRGEMVINAAFLVPQERDSDFAEAVERLGQAVREKGFELERVGPFPPYNFSVLYLKDEEELEIHE